MKSKMKAKFLLSLLSASLFFHSCSSHVEADALQSETKEGYVAYTLDLDAGEDYRALASIKKDYNSSSFGESEDDYFSFTVSGLGDVGTKQDVEVFINKKSADGVLTNIYRKRQQWEVVGKGQLKYDGKIEIPKGLVSDTDELELVAVIGNYTEEKEQNLRFSPYHELLVTDFGGYEFIAHPVILTNSEEKLPMNIPFLLKVGLIRSGDNKKTLKPSSSAKFIPQGVLLVFHQNPNYPYFLEYFTATLEDKDYFGLRFLSISPFGKVTSSIQRPETSKDPVANQFFNHKPSKSGLAVVWLPELLPELEVMGKNAVSYQIDENAYKVVRRGNVYAFVKNW